MTGLTLYIGNKNYSSWSFRPWIGMRMAGIDFEEIVVPFDFPGGNPAIKAISPTGKVPVLKDEDLIIPESLAILDHLARKFPDSDLWPSDMRARTVAMAMACEMISGFQALRNACPMNMRRPRKPVKVSDAIAADVARIEQLWSDALTRSGGPFLCGGFSIADAMYAPVVNRLDVYDLVSSGPAGDYIARIKALPAWIEWESAARAEPWTVEEDEA